MIKMSEKAQSVLKDYFNEKEVTPIRVILQTGGCSGPSLAMVLDEPKDSDDVYEVNGFTMLVDKALHQPTRDNSIMFHTTGFLFQFDLEVAVGGVRCGGGCSPSRCC